MRCDVIAEGIIGAVREVKIGVPLVVRLEGTNVARGKALLDESGLAVISADDLDDGDPADLARKLNEVLALSPAEHDVLRQSARQAVVDRWSWASIARRLLAPV